eukprot:CAMPEP_0204905338 /NCGR_PEP_ID=MMETSP1397-20131031/5367_1 /ASSEMBLY_ACC=CAM_ASM_000891 /TAXON_ID=49980 /ORGANISM="Climacostomum Climacostomum virens, Strain Stock W-24" /LENGTH=286 /DNA_ID=CAMNT_0052074211 /DNA_START=1 /DNA_END=859 /DNA_ORIENTATION=+
MASHFKSFLESVFGRWTTEIENTYVTGLSNSSGSEEGLERITEALFEVTKTRLSTDSDRSALEWLSKFVKTLQKTSFIPKPRVRESLFFPNPKSELRLIEVIDGAKTELLVCVFTITNNNLRDALIRAHERGVTVKVIADDECMKQPGSDIYTLRAVGILCESDSNPAAHMHNKFLVVDNSLLVTGSFNWTVAAVDSNQENLIIIEDFELARQYKEEFERLWVQFTSSAITEERANAEVAKDPGAMRVVEAKEVNEGMEDTLVEDTEEEPIEKNLKSRVRISVSAL